MSIWKRFLDRLATASKEELGTKRLACCDLNQKQSKGDTTSKKK